MVVPLLNIPIISVVLLLLAGILIGHLIWYRDRSDDEAMLAELRGENNDLQAALHQHKQAYVELEADIEDRRKSFEQLKAANLQLEQEQHAKQHDLSEINNELGRLQQLKDQAFHDLDHERQQRRTVQEALAAAEENTDRANSLTDQLRSQISVLQQHQADLEQRADGQLQSQLQEVTAERDALIRDRDALLRRLEEAEEDTKLIADLQEQLQHKQTALQTLETQVGEKDNSVAALQADNETLEETIERNEKEIRRLLEDLQSVCAARDEAVNQVEDWREAQSKLQQQVRNVDQLLAQRDEAMAKAGEVESELEVAQSRIDVLTQELESHTQESHVLQSSHEEVKLELKQENDALQRKLTSLAQEHEAISQVLIDERSRLSSMEAENHRLQVLAQEADEVAAKNNEELRSNLARKQVELDTLRSELEDIASQLSRERHQREHLQDVLHEKDSAQSQFEEERQGFESQISSLESKNESLLSQAAQLISLRGEHAVAQQQIESLTSEIAQQREEDEQAKQAMSDRIDELNRQTSQLTSQLAQLRVEREEQISELDRLQQVHRSTLAGRLELESAKDDLEQELRQLQAELDLAQEKDSTIETLQAELELAQEKDATIQSLQEKLLQLQTELDQALENASSREKLEEQIAVLEQDLDQARELKDSYVELKSRLERVASQRDEAMQTHAEQSETIEMLTKQTRELDAAKAEMQEQFDGLQRRDAEHNELRRTYLQLQTQANETADRLRRVTVERDSQRDALRNAESRLERLEARAKSNEETIRNLRRERASVLANTRQPSTLAYSSLSNRSVPELDSGGRMRRDDVLGMVYTQPPKRKDDLKRISGIAQVLEKKLNAFGVYTYRQIMEWDDVAVAEFSKLLSFRDRIERDDWIGQARNLQYEHYGRAA